MLIKKPRNSVWGVTCSATETQTSSYVIYGVTPMGTVFHSQNTEQTVLMPALVAAAWVFLLCPEQPCTGCYPRGSVPVYSATHPVPLWRWREKKKRKGLREISAVKKTICSYWLFKQPVHPPPYIFQKESMYKRGSGRKQLLLGTYCITL